MLNEQQQEYPVNKVQMATLTQCLNDLKQKGYDQEFKVGNGLLYEMNGQQGFKPEQITIHNFYRFEGESDPGDMEILYALETDNGIKGTLMYAYGPRTSEDSQATSNFIKCVRSLHDDNPKRTEQDVYNKEVRQDTEAAKEGVSGILEERVP